MAKPNSTNFMISFVKDYLTGENSRLDFKLDFHYHLNRHYQKMERENPVIAGCFYFYLAEQDFDTLDSLPDDKHKSLIQKQFDAFLAALDNGIF